MYYPSCFHILISPVSNFGTENEKSRNMGVYEKGILGVAFRLALPVGTHILISSKIPFK
jgi:hypothetical protein